MTIKTQSSINLTTDNLDLMVFHPEHVLANYKEIWETQRVQFLTKEWAKMINYEIPHEKLIAMIQEWVDLPIEERENHILFQNTRQLIEQKDALLEKALPRLHSFFPLETDLSVDIHLTAFNPARSFAKYDIVLMCKPHTAKVKLRTS